MARAGEAMMQAAGSEHTLAEALARSERRRDEVERIAQMGSWEWDIPSDRITWSPGLFHLFGLEPSPGAAATYEEYVGRLHPDDRERIQANVAEARRTGEPFSHVHRVVLPSGEVRSILGRGESILDEHGVVIRMVGTSQDITDRLAMEREVAARLAAEAAFERSSVLVEAGVELASVSLDYEKTLQRVASLAVPRIADWCAVDLMHEDGTLTRVATYHRDPEKVRFVRELAERYPTDPASEIGAHAVMRSARAVMGEVTEDMMDRVAVDDEHLRLVRALSLRQFVIAPLVGRDGPIGAISFVNDTARPGLGHEHLLLAEELGRRAGIAIENARLHQMVRESQAQLEEQAAELQAQTAQLEAVSAETEAANEELRITTEELMQRSQEAESAQHEIAAILESIGDAFFALDEAWCFTYVNHRAEALLQRPGSELIGRSIWDEFPAAAASDFGAAYRRVMDSREVARFEAYYAPLDMWFDVGAYPAVPGGIAVYFRDVTVRRRAEVQFGTLAETMPQLVWSTTEDGYHDYYNSRWYEFTGMPREGSQGWNWKNFLHPDDYDRAVATWQRSLQSGEPYTIEYRFKESATGRYRWFLGRALPLRDERQRIIRWFGTCTDIDDTKRAEADRDAALREAQRARVEAETANRAKAEFLAAMSHELRTPINAALGYCELLAMGIRGPVSAAQQEDLARIQRSQRLLLSLVNDILNFARLEAGQIEFHLADAMLDDTLASLDAMISPQMDAKGLRYRQSGCEGVRLRADVEKLQQVLLNLLTNSVKFTAAGGEIDLACDADDEWVSLSVRDTGRGIAPGQLERIFEPFVQLDRHLTHASQQGVGLGLAISRDLMRAMGGELTVASTLGQGSTFVARIPRVH
jgi:PAS domain S-box-containing protein